MSDEDFKVSELGEAAYLAFRRRFNRSLTRKGHATKERDWDQLTSDERSALTERLSSSSSR